MLRLITVTTSFGPSHYPRKPASIVPAELCDLVFVKYKSCGIYHEEPQQGFNRVRMLQRYGTHGGPSASRVRSKSGNAKVFRPARIPVTDRHSDDELLR